MNGYKENRPWSDGWIPKMRAIIGQRLLKPSSLEEDRTQAVDLVVLRGRDMTMACRMRTYGIADRYPHDFTIRSRLDSGAKTELAKIEEGWADWMFYGHDAGDGRIYPWRIIDLHSFRAHLIRGHPRPPERPNGDGSYFRAYDVRSFPSDPPLLIDESRPAELPHVNGVKVVPAPIRQDQFTFLKTIHL